MTPADHMRTVAFFCVALGLIDVAAPAALAQAIGPPTTATGGRFGPSPNRSLGSSPQLTLTLDLGGGYDQAPEAGETGTPLPLFEQAGTLGSGAATLYFRKGAARRLIEATGGAYFNRSTIGLRRVVGGEASVQWAHTLGPRTGTTVNVIGASQPATLFNAFGPVAGQVEGEVPATSPTQGVTPQQWVSAQGGVGFYRHLTSRQRFDVRYLAGYREPTSGPGLTNRNQGVSYVHTWNPRQNLAFTPTYRFNENRQRDDLGREVPLGTHAAVATLTLTRGLPAGRSVSLSGGVGMTHARYGSGPAVVDFNLATYAGYARAQLRPGWRVSLDAARDVSVLEGVSPEPFATNSVTARTDGVLGRRLQFALTAAHSVGGGLTAGTGAFETSVGAAQLQYALGQFVALYGSYAHYRYRLDAVQPVGTLPNEYNLNSVRVGVNLWWPLYGRP